MEKAENGDLIKTTIPSPRTGQTLWLESALARLHERDLSTRGELLLTRDSRNAVQLAAQIDGKLTAVADPRKGGSAEAKNPP